MALGDDFQATRICVNLVSASLAVTKQTRNYYVNWKLISLNEERLLKEVKSSKVSGPTPVWGEAFTFDLDCNTVRLEAELWEYHVVKDVLLGVRSFLLPEIKVTVFLQ